MITKIFEIITKTDKAEKDLKNVAKASDDAADGVEKVNKGLEKTNKEAKKTSRLGKAFGIAKKGAKGLAGGFRMIGTALKAAGIGLIVSLFLALKSALEQNQKAMDALAVVTETISIAFSEVAKVLKEVYDNVSKASENFDALGKVMGGILTLVITPFKLGFQGIKAAIVGAQLAWEDSFLGGKDPEKIKELKAELDEIKGDVVEIGTEAVEAGKSIVENAGEALSEVADIGSQVIDGLKEISVEAAIENAKANVELKKSAELAAVANQGLIEKYDRQAEQQRQIRDDERKSVADRKKANEQLAAILEKQETAMKANAKTQLKSAEAILKKDEENVEALIAKREALNELAAIEATIEGFRSEQKVNAAALQKEEQELINSRLESENNLTIERKRINAEQIEDNIERLEKLKEIDAQERDIELKRLQSIIDTANAGTQAKIDAEIAFNEAKLEFDRQALERAKELADAQVAANKEKNDKKDADDEAQKEKDIAREQRKQDDIQSIQANTLSAISNLITAFENQNEKNAKKAFNLQKALGIVETLINTSVAIMKVAKETTDFTPVQALRTGNMIAMGIAGAAQVAAIASQKFTPSGASGGNVPTPNVSGGGASATQAPSFNVVGQSGFNQIAGALGQQPPAQAFVVAGDVTTAQQLQNNTIQQATF
jgi:hypothetical protein|tara:strand:- start:64 stop:2055 length:1992 start_codon:yes stop_codon:yes gene_type:complete